MPTAGRLDRRDSISFFFIQLHHTTQLNSNECASGPGADIAPFSHLCQWSFKVQPKCNFQLRQSRGIYYHKMLKSTRKSIT